MQQAPVAISQSAGGSEGRLERLGGCDASAGGIDHIDRGGIEGNQAAGAISKQAQGTAASVSRRKERLAALVSSTGWQHWWGSTGRAALVGQHW